MRHVLRITCVVVATTFAPACTHRLLVSEPITNDAAAGDAERGGLTYSLPMTVITVAGVRDRDTQAVSYTITPSILPDPAARYRLKYTPSQYGDDDIDLKVDPNGLLNSTKGNSTDRTGDIIVAIGKTIAAGGVQLAPSPGAPPPQRGEDRYPFTAVFTATDFVRARKLRLPDDSYIELADDEWIPRDEMTRPAPACSYSVCFRRVFPIHAKIVRDGVDTNRYQFAFVAINPYQTEGIDLSTASLVTRTNQVTFKDGLIGEVAINQPSTILAIAKLPLTVLKEILAVPAELLTIKGNNVKAEGDLARAQADLLTQMKAVIDAQQALETARAAARQAGKPNAVTGTGTSP